MTENSPTERELDVLKVLWELGESKVRDIHEAMNTTEPCAFTTVQTLLRIMAGKGLVEQRAEGRTLYYRPLYSREQSTSRFLDRVFDGAIDQFVLNMLHDEKVSSEQMRDLERLIAKARRAKEAGE